MNFKEIVIKQYALNDLFSKKTWINNPKVDMYSAIRDEANELAESAGWVPWWKGQEPKFDLENCQVEVIDILHFHIGAAIQETQYELVQNTADFREGLDEDNAEDFADEFVSSDVFHSKWKSGTDFVRYTENERDLAIDEVTECMMNAMSSEFATNVIPKQGHVDAVNAYLGAVLVYGARDSFTNFFELAATFEMTPELVYWMYTAKHALNTFRKTNNYDGKDATRPKYNKIWNGNEDNYHVMKHVRTLIETNVPLTTDKIIEDIGTIYRAIGQPQ